MKRIIVISVIIIFLIIGCTQKPTKPTQPTTAPEEPAAQEQKQICTARWMCQDGNTKVYRKSDCAFEQLTNCPAGCENGECKTPPTTPQPKPVETKEPEKPKEEAKKSCALGWACLDNSRKGYRSSNCVFDNVVACKYGCKDGECIATAPPEEKKEETFYLSEGKGSIKQAGYTYCDFSKNQTFQNEVYDSDLKIKLYAASSGYNYFRSESSTSNLWVIEKGIKEATRADCMAKIAYSNAYESLKSGQTLCLITKEDNIVLLGGYWQGLPSESTELSWKYYT